MYEFALCDDDTDFHSSFAKMLSHILDAKNTPYHLSTFASIESLHQSINNGKKFDLLFLDILFESTNGLCFAKILRKQNQPVDIIFISTSREYAVESYDVSPLYYLMKPIEPKALKAALDRFLNKTLSQSIFLTTPKGLLHIYITDILYFEIYGHEIIIHRKGGTKELCQGTLKNIEKFLPPMTFLRPHRSYLVSLDQITEISRYQIRLSSGEYIPISKALYNQVQNQFIDYASIKNAAF